MIKQDIIDGEDKTFENKFVTAVSSNNLKNNVLIGSYVVIPKSRVSSPFDLNPDEWQATLEIIKVVKAYIDEKYKPDGYNLGWNVGKAGGQSVEHAHLHIIPRYNDEPYTGKGIRYWLKKEENIRHSLKSNTDN